MEPVRFGLGLLGGAAAYAASDLHLTPFSAAVLGGAAGGVLKRVYDEYASQEDTQFDDYTYAVPPSKRLRGTTDTMDVMNQGLTTQPMAYSRKAPRVGIKKVYRKKRTYRKKTVSRPKSRVGFAQVGNPKHPLNLRKLAHKQTAIAAYNVNTTGTFTLLNGLTLGTTQLSDRIGKDVFLKDLFIQGKMYTGTTTTTFQGRIIVFRDIMPNGSTPALTDVLVEASSSSAYNVTNLNRFMILYDQTASLTGALGTDNSQRAVAIHVPLNFVTYYNSGNAGTIADIEKNSLYMLLIGDIAAGTAAGTLGASLHLTYIAQ